MACITQKYYAASKDDGRFDYPAPVYRVTGGAGDEVFLIVGSEKAALCDAGMPFNGEALVRNIKAILGERPLDYCFLTHSHFDHAGGVPYLRKAWPDLAVVGSEYAAYVFTRPGARALMQELSETSARQFGGAEACEVTLEGLAITRIAEDGDRFSLGDCEVVCMASPGHTRCSMSFALEPQKYLFAGESTGVMLGRGACEPAILTSYEDAMASLAAGRSYGASRIFSPHYGVTPEGYAAEYWDVFEKTANEEKRFIEEMYRDGLTPEEMISAFADRYFCEERGMEQSYEAFAANALATFRLYAPAEGDN